ncbi:MAG: septal ring lytic transglycosylase RlpA family protein [Parcubacteria group bacterium]|nr:septal ring lytic transglycosylase RlpA family protein [Parcubacteria group bacterium]
MKKMIWMVVVVIVVFIVTMKITEYQKSRTHSYTTVASWYGEFFHGKTTASGEKYDMYDPFTAAHKTLPFKTKVKITYLSNGKSIIVRINDRGPYVPGRGIDLSYAGAKKLGLIEKGFDVVKIEISTSEKFYFYRIKSKETLWRLFGHDWSIIAKINNISPKKIKKGMRILVPYDLDSAV